MRSPGSHALFLATLIAFNVWHSFDRGVWDPISAIDSLGLSESRAESLSAVDSRLRPARHPYDGQYFYVMTYDPLLVSRERTSLLDDPAYRSRRMLYPLIAHALALGRPRGFPYTLLLVNVLFFLWGALLVGRMAHPGKWTILPILAYFGNTGLVYCAFRTLPEPIGMCLSLLGLLFWRRGRRFTAALLFASAALVRESFALVPLSVAAWAVFFERRSMREIVAPLALALSPLVIWTAYVALRLPPSALDPALEPQPWQATPAPGIGRFTFPFVGIAFEARQALETLTTRTEIRRTISLVFAALAVMAVVGVAFVRRPSFWGFLCVSQAAFLSVLRGDIWNYHAGSSRLLIPLFVFSTLWCVEECSRRRMASPGSM